MKVAYVVDPPGLAWKKKAPKPPRGRKGEPEQNLAFENVAGWEVLPEDVVDRWLRQRRGRPARWASLQKLVEEQPSDERGLTRAEHRALYLHRRGW